MIFQVGKQLLPVHQRNHVVIRVKKLVELTKPTEKSAQKTLRAVPMPAPKLIEKSQPLGGKIAHRQLPDSIPSLVENCRASAKRNHMNRQFAPTSADRINQVVALCLASSVRNKIDAAPNC